MGKGNGYRYPDTISNHEVNPEEAHHGREREVAEKDQLNADTNRK